MPTKLSDIQIAIKKSGAKWVAGETPISLMTARQRSKLFVEKRYKLIKYPKPNLPMPLPPILTIIDWSNMNGQNYVSSPKMQDSSNCSVFSTTAALESCAMRYHLTPQNYDLNLAEQVIQNSPESGLPNVEYLSGFLKDTGLPEEALYLNNLSTGSSTWRDHTYRISGWAGIYPETIDQLRGLIFEYGPLVVCLNTVPSFCNYHEGVWHQLENETSIGGHQVLVFGFDDIQKCFHCKNSWGKRWGECLSGGRTENNNGYFRIAYDEFKKSPVGFGGNVYAYWAAVGPSPMPGTWPGGKTINDDDMSSSAPTSCVFNDRNFLFWRGVKDDHLWFSASPNGVNWPNGKMINATDRSIDSPTPCVFNNKLYLFWLGAKDNSIWYSASSDGLSWPAGKKINSSDLSSDKPAVCEFGGHLYVIWRGYADNNIWYSPSTDGMSWPAGKKINNSDGTPTSPSVCCAFDKLYVFWKGVKDDYIWFSASNNGTTWPPGNRINNSDCSKAAPSAINVIYNKIYLFWKGTVDPFIWYASSTNGTKWTAGKKVNDSDKSSGTIASTYFLHSMYLFWRGVSDECLWYSEL